MSRGDKVAVAVALVVAATTRGAVYQFDNTFMSCSVAVCGSDHLPAWSAVLAFVGTLIAWGTWKGAR